MPVNVTLHLGTLYRHSMVGYVQLPADNLSPITKIETFHPSTTFIYIELSMYVYLCLYQYFINIRLFVFVMVLVMVKWCVDRNVFVKSNFATLLTIFKEDGRTFKIIAGHSRTWVGQW